MFRLCVISRNIGGCIWVIQEGIIEKNNKIQRKFGKIVCCWDLIRFIDYSCIQFGVCINVRMNYWWWKLFWIVLTQYAERCFRHIGTPQLIYLETVNRCFELIFSKFFHGSDPTHAVRCPSSRQTWNRMRHTCKPARDGSWWSVVVLCVFWGKQHRSLHRKRFHQPGSRVSPKYAELFRSMRSL